MRKRIYVLVLASILVYSCNGKNESTAEKNTSAKAFDYTISKGALGDIKIGTYIADYKLDTLRKQAVDVYEYHYGGGGNAYKYGYKGEDLFILMPAMDSDSIIAIMAISPKFRTSDGLSPKATVQEILAKYPDMKLRQDLMSGGEYMYTEPGKLKFVFETLGDKPIGTYAIIDEPGKPVQMDVRCDWIEIK